MKDRRPDVGLGVMVFKEGKVLLAMRKGSHGAGTFAAPGGHLEWGETFEACVRRECHEEAGIEIKNVKFALAANMIGHGGKHYVHATMQAEWAGGEPQILEPHKSGEWGWYDPDDLPQPMYE